MTEPTPPTEPFTTLQELAVWTQETAGIPEDRRLFAEAVLNAVAIVIRSIGSQWWTRASLPPRIKLMADLKAKNFYEHPTGAVSETVGPLSERFLDEVVRQISFTDDEEALIRELAPTEDGEAVLQTIWVLTTTRGPLETHGRSRDTTVYVPYWRATSKAIPYFTAGELGSP